MAHFELHMYILVVFLFLKQLEFAVQLTCQSCVDAVNSALKGQQGIRYKSKNIYFQNIGLCLKSSFCLYHFTVISIVDS